VNRLNRLSYITDYLQYKFFIITIVYFNYFLYLCTTNNNHTKIDMLRRKFTNEIEANLKDSGSKIMLVNGARQIGKSYLIRYVGKRLFPNYVEVNLKKDSEGDGIFRNIHSTQDLYMRLGDFAEGKLGDAHDTLVFLDEIQTYPHLLTMLKFLREENRFRYIASGSQLGIALAETPSIPMGSIDPRQMFPLDFEEFLWAVGTSEETIEQMRKKFNREESPSEDEHSMMMKRFRYYLLIGGLPEAVNHFLEDRNIVRVRKTQSEIHELYKLDASQYDSDRKLKIRKIYDLIPSVLENRKKRIIFKNIENKKGKDYMDYEDEFDFLINSGITLGVTAISNPVFPLMESEHKNLIKLYLNDVGILTQLLYGLNVNAVLDDQNSINLGTVYESVVAQELNAHGFPLHYYDNKKLGEVDFLVDEYDSLNVLPIEVKSGKDYRTHASLARFMANNSYDMRRAIVFCNDHEIIHEERITYMPVYYSMFLTHPNGIQGEIILPEL